MALFSLPSQLLHHDMNSCVFRITENFIISAGKTRFFEIISQHAVSVCTHYVPFAWNSLSLANIVATQVSLSPRSQRLSIVLIWSFHPHCLNMGYPSDPWSDLPLPPLLSVEHRAWSPAWWRTCRSTSTTFTITSQSHAWKFGINTASFPPSALFFHRVVWLPYGVVSW